MGYVNIAAALTAVVQTVKTANPTKLAAVFDYDVPGVGAEGYPFACISNIDGEEEPLDTANNKTLYKFLIRIADVAKDKHAVEAKLRSLADLVLAELRKRANQSFGGIADKVFPFKSVWRWENSENVPYRILEIQVTIEQSESIG